MPNVITNLLDIKDDDLIVKALPAPENIQIYQVERKATAQFCPICNYRMHSKGTYTRTVNHPIKQGGVQVILKVRQRRWQCTNPECRHYEVEEFNFISKYKRNTNYADILIVNAFRDFSKTAAQIAREYHVSDTYALQTFDRYVDMKRGKLTPAICIDEVHLNISSRHRYALIIQDFVTGEPIDMVVSRREDITLPYFVNIPKHERMLVKYVITDMYKPYLNYIDKYFYNAIPIVDSFHVVSQINQHLLRYIRALQRNYKERDIRRKIQMENERHEHIRLKTSKEVHLLRDCRWIILANQKDIRYWSKPTFDGYFNCRMYVADYERELFKLDADLKYLRDLKEKYIEFNDKYAGRSDDARPALNALISLYKTCPYEIFNTIGFMLEEYKEPILNSFNMLQKINKKGDPYLSRLSNGPIESLNRAPKDMKRNARGYKNFDHIRNRFLFAKRKDAPILAFPKNAKEIKYATLKKRGPYRKYKK